MLKSIFFIFLLYSISINAQYTYFNNRYNNDYLSSGKSIIETDSGYVINGVSAVLSGEFLFLRIVMTEIDYQGNQLYWKTYGEDFHNYYGGDFRSMDKTFDGGYVVGGGIEDSIRVVGFLMKFDQNGDSLWTKIYGDTISPYYTGSYFRVCRELPDHSFILAGANYVSEDDGDILVTKTDSLGNILWSHTYGQLHIVEEAFSIAQLPDNGFIIGFVKANLNLNYSSDPGVLKVDSLGNQIWLKYYGSYKDDWGSAVAVSQDSNYLLGTTYAIEEPGPGNPMMKARILKTDTAGNIIWDKKYSQSLFMGSSSTIDELPDGSIIASGSGAFDDCMCNMAWIIKVKPNGDSIWMRRYVYKSVPNLDDDFLYDLYFTSDHGIIFTGETTGPIEHLPYIWVQKLDSIGCDSVGCDTTVGIYERNRGLEACEYGRLQIWPNPAKDVIQFKIIQDRLNNFPFVDRELEIFNVFGEKIIGIKMSIFQETYTQDISSFAQGLYLVVIRERQKVTCTGKFLISR
jgi:hypothetical protein